MHDIRWIKDNPELFDRAMVRRGDDARAADLIAIDEKRASTVKAMNDAQAEQKQVSKKIGAAKGQGDEAAAQAAMAEVGALKNRVKELEEEERQLAAKLREELLPIPNIMDEDVPEGADESDNIELRSWGEPKTIENAKDHVDLGEALGMMDFEAAAKLSGSRFVVLKRDLAKLERALANFMLQMHTEEFGYEEVQTPVLVHAEPLEGTDKLPKFEEDLFKTTGDHYLIPTAEVTLTSLVADAILSEVELPKRMTAWTQCFRAEAGSAGRDTRGLIRMHQFSKVELVSVTTPEASDEEHERMTHCAEEVLKRLDLPFRTMLLCSGDIGFGAAKTYDLEVWLPSQGTYREISSCSNTRGFQARRMNARFRREGQKKPDFVHTLNGSGLAIGRTMVAILENYQQPDGSIAVPDVLKPFMGKDVIGRE
ncbi:serine--tRNA ligase [Parvularcula sp. ZS-1/3]|uniref:Serine--tRNA ligase n=1 Tax=Parvularcula mediterranea TaxID=2732508 RepID=A0A7Y3RNJ8_9PROT|nr:serine--tRNA ligase [Parvularcula mediterranea]NNU17328.1 serine--tRNA ligase [Parvularcula mediterranea]